MSDGLGWTWAPDGTQASAGEDALRPVPPDAVLPDVAARRPSDVVIPAVPLGGDPRLAADAVTRWMDEDRERALPPAPRRAPARHPGKVTGDVLPQPAPPPAPPASRPAPVVTPVPRPRRAAAWAPVLVLAVMVIVIFLVALAGGG